MSYKQIKIKPNKYNIMENETGNVIVIEDNEKNIKTICRKLNLGSGFNGFTPQFFSEFKGMKIN